METPPCLDREIVTGRPARTSAVRALVCLLGVAISVGCTRPTDAWIADLDDPNELTRRLAALALREVPTRDSEKAVLALTRATTDRRGSVARAAVDSLRALHDVAVPLLLSRFGEPATSARDRRAIVFALSGIGLEATRAILYRMPKIDDPDDRLELARAIARSDDVDNALPLLLDAMQDDERASTRSFAVLAVSLVLAENDTRTAESDALRDALIRATTDDDRAVRIYAVRALARLATLDQRALRAIENVLESAERQSLRRTAILALAPRYVAALADREVNTAAAAHAEAALARCGDAAIPALVEVLRRDDPQHAAIAADRLVSRGAPSVEPLLELLAEEDFSKTTLVVDTLARIGVPAIDSLIETVRFGLWRARPNAAAALGRIPAGASRSVPVLTELLEDETSPVRLAAILALARLLPASLTSYDAVRAAAATLDRSPAIDQAIERFAAAQTRARGG